MGIFDRLKRRKKRDIESAFSDIENDLTGTPKEETVSGNALMNHCEQLVEFAKDFEDAKTEYQVVTAYLNDIETLAGLDEEKAKETKDAATQLFKLSKEREEYLHTEKKLSDVQYLQMEQEEKQFPTDVKRLTENEDMLDVLNRDMTYLEGEKLTWEYTGNDLKKERKRLRTESTLLLIVAAMMTGFYFVFQYLFQMDVTLTWLAILFLLAILAVLIFWRMQSNAKETKQAAANKNRAITLLNKVKIKYVNVKNAVDYTYEKYHVRSSRQLKKNWEYYVEEKREKEKYIQTNEDLEYYMNKLQSSLRVYHLYDAKVWLGQPQALVDDREMVEIKHHLIERRKKLRNRMNRASEQMREKKEELEKLVESYPQNAKEIEEMIASVHRMTGI